MRNFKFLVLISILTVTTLLGYSVTFIVEAPVYTPDDESIYLAGNFNNWNPKDEKYVLAKEYDHYSITVELSGNIEFKFTRGSWETVEKGQNGQEIANRTLYVDKDMTVQLEIMHWRDFVERRQVNLRNTYTGNIKLVKDFYSPQLENYRDVVIYLPPDYENSGERYGVMYMHDGQNVFDATTSFAGVEWGADETAQELTNSGIIRPIIIVGIYNKGVDRLNEYSPWVDESYGGGDGDLYAQFVVETLKPYIDSNFRTLPDRENTVITGSSLGGFISLYMGVKYNDIFSKIGVMSAAFWFANGEIMNYVKNANFEKQTKIYMDIGTAEGNDATVYLEGSRTMREILLSKANVELSYIEEKGGTHSESAWARRLPQLLTYFFGKTSK